MAKQPHIRCSACKGTGLVPLTGEHLMTFLKLAELRGERSGAELAKIMGVQPTAMNNRLAVLERHGLLTSRRWGRLRLFSVRGK